MATTRETVICHTGEEAGKALAAGQVAWLAMECGMCRQRTAEEIHAASDMRFHQVAEEEVAALRAAVLAHIEARDGFYNQHARKSGRRDGHPLDDGTAARETWRVLRELVADAPATRPARGEAREEGEGGAGTAG